MYLSAISGIRSVIVYEGGEKFMDFVLLMESEEQKT